MSNENLVGVELPGVIPQPSFLYSGSRNQQATIFSVEEIKVTISHLQYDCKKISPLLKYTLRSYKKTMLARICSTILDRSRYKVPYCKYALSAK